MGKRVILHIGLHKTGTSSLQRAFTKNRELLRQHGIAYPLPAGSLKRGQHDLGTSVARKTADEIANCWRTLEPFAGRCHTVLLSTETLSSAPQQGIAAFKALLQTRLKQPDFTIYVGIRRWSDRLVSLWHERIRAGSVESLPDFVQQHCGKEPVGHLLDIASPIERWASIFGRSAVKVAAMERLTEAGRDLVVETFRELLGIEAGFLEGRYRFHQSAPSETELIRAVNRCPGEQDKATPYRVARATLRHLKEKNELAVKCAALLEHRMTDLALDDRHPAFLALEATALARCGDLIGHNSDGGIFPVRPPRTWRYAPDEVLDEPEIRSRIEVLRNEAVRRVQAEYEGRTAQRRAQAEPLASKSWLSQVLELRLRKT